MTLTDFLLARIAEDEAFARKAERDSVVWAPGDAGVCDEQGSHVGYPPGRVLAECNAKRRIVAKVQRELDADIHNDRATHLMYDTLELLALPFADHPDYREEWRP